MGNKVFPPPLFDIDFDKKNGGITPIYPEEEGYDYNNKKPWYIIKEPKYNSVDSTFGVDEDRVWFQCITPTCDVILHNFSAFLAIDDLSCRCIFDENGTIVCDYRAVNVNLGSYELMKTIVLKKDITYYFPVGNLHFIDERNNVFMYGVKIQLDHKCIPDKLKGRTYRLYNFEKNDFIDSNTGKPYKVGDTISPTTISSVTTSEIHYLEINKRIVVPDFEA